MQQDQFYNERQALVDYLISRGSLRTKEVIEAFMNVPRHLFVGKEEVDNAYKDMPLPILKGITISQPSVVATMIEALGIEKGDKILDVGTGSGWAAALLGYCTGKDGIVVSIEEDMYVAEFARSNLKSLDIENVEVIIGDGTAGYGDKAPYNEIIYDVAMPKIPISVLKQLSIGGVLIAPVGEEGMQELVRIERKKEDRFNEEKLGSVVFTCAFGKFGFAPR
ncbi:MAG: protein-L-isoaspartate(D-aspartate) O-methyltransferase [Candidatus Micrarchaeia archaeon]